MKYKLLFVIFLLLAPLSLKAADLKIAFADMKNCIEKSKIGKREKNNFEALKKQMSENLEKTDKELADLAKKLEDPEFVDSLSPTAEEELKQKFQKLSQEFVRYQNQYYQLLNQANVKILQQLGHAICQASEKVRDKKKLDVIFNEESAFAFAPSLDVTDEVIKELDARFEQESTTAETKQ